MKKTREEMSAFLGEGTEFEGKLSFTGSVRLDGRFKGEIFSEGTLVVGDSAFIEGDIEVSEIIVSGEIKGSIVASKRIEIHAPGKVFGNIQSPIVIIDEGVIFEGTCKMQSLAKEDEKKVAVIS
ncbi:MAG: polymer-forming cytoskeletal protein [Deltaproteobacteria bacterium]|nr:polymer-forming cytoskeletal protein [Deltaproteobacteria bacterium]MBW2083593.1 polymer-forming cytoskeletal protein [Deltaproteobacteria bacterium]HDM10197.1 polymer-forming cytoskeletal protein [Desulfobacteraceae bacterium]